MGKYGLKIKNFQAGSIYEYNLGVRDIYDYTDAMLPNSLFLDYLMTLKKFDNFKKLWYNTIKRKKGELYGI